MQQTILFAVLSLLVGGGVGFYARMIFAQKKTKEAESKAQNIVNEAKTQQKELILEAKDGALKISEDAKKEENQRRQQIQHAENRIEKRENTIDQKLDNLEKKDQALEVKIERVKEAKDQIESLKQEQIERLEKVAGLTREQGRKKLLEALDKELEGEVASRIKKAQTFANEESEKKSRGIIGLAIERFARDQTSEMTSTNVKLTSDDMKGRIIGKEGRNIRRLEELTGIEIVVDDTPGMIVVTGFNPIRRHVAKRALEALMKDGRIHPARIEELVQKAKEEISKDIKDAGESTCYDLGIADLHPKLVQLVGRLKFRSSYGQNVLKHSIEVASIATIMATEIGADVAVAKRAALLHDIGKAVDHEVEGTHLEIGRNILEKFGASRAIIHGMECHHGDYEPTTVEALIVNASDAISGGRVGARKDSHENYIKRLQELENVASSFKGIKKAYAIQAGREVRIFVRPEEINDAAALKLARDIAMRVQKELVYPGEIKINVIRENRAIEYAH